MTGRAADPSRAWPPVKAEAPTDLARAWPPIRPGEPAPRPCCGQSAADTAKFFGDAPETAP